MIVHGRHKRVLSTWQFLALGYLIVILIGTFVLSLPISSKAGEWTPFIDSLFTSTSATCVTGLVVFDTYAHWSIFGQLVILLMIQIGGIGFMTIFSLISIAFHRKIGIYERRLIMHSSNNNQISGMMHLIRRILIGTLLFETIGTALLAIRFCQDFGFGNGLYYSMFHSVSAFCNAGFDLFGKIVGGEGSLSSYAGDPLVILTLSALIVVGGIGFVVWNDFIQAKSIRLKSLHLYSRIVLISTTVLIVVGTGLFILFEHNHAFKGMDGGTMFLSALFASITPRTAGFFSVSPAALSDSGLLLTIILMFIGGSSGSTAGGIKVSTIVIIIFALFASVRNSKDINIGKRRVDSSVARQALAIFSFYLFAIILATTIMCAIEDIPLRDILFEVGSAISTVGLSTGITASLSTVSRIILMILMYSGRVGMITLALAIGERHKNPPINRPIDHVTVG